MALLSGTKKRTKTRRKKRKETKVEALLRARGSETLGFGFLVLALVLAASFATYSPNDPSFFNQTSQPSGNLLGVFGSYVSDVFHWVLGLGFWTIPVVFLVWGGV